MHRFGLSGRCACIVSCLPDCRLAFGVSGGNRHRDCTALLSGGESRLGGFRGSDWASWPDLPDAQDFVGDFACQVAGENGHGLIFTLLVSLRPESCFVGILCVSFGAAC